MTAWSKILGVFVGIPVAIAAALFAFFGIKTYADLKSLTDTLNTTRAELTETLSTTREALTSAQNEVDSALAQAARLQSTIESEEGELQKQVVGLQSRLSEFEKELQAAETRFSERQDRLESTVDALAGRISLGSGTENLEEIFAEYLAHLDRLGFTASETEVAVEISDVPAQASNAYFMGGETPKVVIGRGLAADHGIALREYTHHVLTLDFPNWNSRLNSNGVATRAVETALVDFYPASFLNRPKVGELAAQTLGLDQGHIRNLDNDLNFGDYLSRTENTDPFSAHYASSEVLGGLLWDLRNAVSTDETERAALAAWRENASLGASAPLEAFLHALFAALSAHSDNASARVTSIFEKRGFPVPEPD